MLQGKGRALMLPPGWIWESLGQHAPEAGALACQAVDLSSAANYFQVLSGGRLLIIFYMSSMMGLELSAESDARDCDAPLGNQ